MKGVILLKSKIIIIIILGATIACLFLIKGANTHENQYEKIVHKIENKETFNLVLSQNNDKEAIVKILDYYKKMYDLDYEIDNIDFNSTSYNSLIKKLGLRLTELDKNIYVIIKEGRLVGYFLGDFNESAFKNSLIASKMVDEKYSKIDAIVKNSFKDYYTFGEDYCILYISPSDNNLYKYRKVLVESEIKSLVVYVEGPFEIKIDEYFNGPSVIDKNDVNKLPVVVKIKNKRIISSKSGVTLRQFSEFVKNQ